MIQRLVVSNRTLGVVVNGKFYATLTDHLGSIIAVLDGERQVITRSYDLWGNKKVQVSAGYEELEKLIAWSFAGLIEPPQLSGKGLYWSKSRVYSSDLKHWLSIDPAVLYNPEKLITSTKDWNGMLYCNGDPVNFVDPSGHYSQHLQAVINASWGRNEPQRVMNAVKDAAKTVGYIAGAGATVGAITIAGPPLLAAAAPKVAGLVLAGTIEYNAAMIGVGGMIANNPQLAENIIGAGYSFISGFAAGISDTNSPKYDGNYTPGDMTLNFFSSETGNYLGSQIRSNYVQE